MTRMAKLIYSLTLVAPDVGVGRTVFEVTAPLGSAEATPVARLRPTSADRPSMASASSEGANAVGIAVLGADLVALAAGSTVAVARRRRVAVAPPGR